MNANRRRAIVQRAQTLLHKYSVEAPPVPVERIAKGEGAQLRFAPLDDELSGMIYVKDGTPIIGINSLHHPNRQRFTIAHECGHLMLHKAQITKEVHVDKTFSILARNAESADGTTDIEIEANLFAAELLMPAALLMDEVGDEILDIDNDGAVSTLAKVFRVSQSAMRFRLGNLFA